MYLKSVSKVRACKNAFRGVSLLLKAERGKTSISKIGSSNLRKALYFPAIVAKTHNPLFKEFTQKLSSKGKPTKVIIVAIMRKLLHIVFGVIKNKTQFNPNLLLDS